MFEFHHFFHLGASQDTVKGQGHIKTKYGEISTSVREAYLTNWLWEFHLMYNFGAVMGKHELIRFWGQKVEGQGHIQNKYGQKSLVSSKDYLVSSILILLLCIRLRWLSLEFVASANLRLLLHDTFQAHVAYQTIYFYTRIT